MRFEEDRRPASAPQTEQPVLSGRCWVVDGDTIVIDRVHIRLAGIDAPELDHPWGQQSKWALVKLCKGQMVTARLKPELSYDRVVAECFLPDGRDIAAEMVKAGLALDWPKFSGGKYRTLEPADARKKLWRASLRQSGVMWPSDDQIPAPHRPRERASKTAAPPGVVAIRSAGNKYWIGWVLASITVALLVGCSFAGGSPGQNTSLAVDQQRSGPANLEVTAGVLNVRQEPTARSIVIAQIDKGTIVTASQMSGNWYAIAMADGRTGWVHSDYLMPAPN